MAETEKKKLTPGERVKAFRNKQKPKPWSLRRMAKESDIAAGDLSLIERGKVNIGLYRAAKLAQVMGIKPEKLCPPPVVAKRKTVKS